MDATLRKLRGNGMSNSECAEAMHLTTSVISRRTRQLGLINPNYVMVDGRVPRLKDAKSHDKQSARPLRPGQATLPPLPSQNDGD